MYPDGSISIKGRAADAMRFKVFGDVVYPGPIEQAVSLHPKVAQVSVSKAQTIISQRTKMYVKVCYANLKRRILHQAQIHLGRDTRHAIDAASKPRGKEISVKLVTISTHNAHQFCFFPCHFFTCVKSHPTLRPAPHPALSPALHPALSPTLSPPAGLYNIQWKFIYVSELR